MNAVTETHEHSYPIQPPDGTIFAPGDCECGSPYSDVEKAFDAEVAATEWAVYVVGLGILLRQDIDLADDDPANPPFTEESARKYVAWANTEMQPIVRDATQPFAIVLHHGVPVDETAVA